jgi:hypothetical protein
MTVGANWTALFDSDRTIAQLMTPARRIGTFTS